MNKQNLQQEITKLEAQISTMQDSLNAIKETLQNLKDIAWDKHSKKESSSMYKILQDEKESTQVKSNAGDIKVDKEFMQKQIQKHLDYPHLRGMVTTQEMLSFSKVAKNVEAEYNKENKDYTWKVKANDESILTYGSRKYAKDGKEINRLLTAHSKTERGQRQADRVSSATYFNDPDFRGSANENIPQNPNISQINSKESKIAEMRERVKNTLNSNKKQINKDTSSHIDR